MNNAVNEPVADVAGDYAAPAQKQGYILIPKVGVDTPGIIMGDAAARLSNGKEPYPVIVMNKDDAIAFQRSMTQYLEENKDVLNDAGVSTVKVSRGRSKKRSEGLSEMSCWLAQAVKSENVRILNNEVVKVIESLCPDSTKLYIVGHGSDGGNGMYYKDSGGKFKRISPAELAEQLKAAGLSAKYRDIRLLCCHGACQPEDESKTSTARKITNALGKAGFKDVDLSAYEGPVSTNPKLFDGTLHSSVTRDGQSKPVRRSQARKTLQYAQPAATKNLPAESTMQSGLEELSLTGAHGPTQ
ncbi:C80 family cysteine peptidase [Pseudoxanthomonas sp. UTMC 1351]|uniref:C80 family cysteine peptidase n=1 Tax=Pseudoxanthomonas sp. UTMC 1351 TaxID=2695853 RepID=UPI0034CFCF93